MKPKPAQPAEDLCPVCGKPFLRISAPGDTKTWVHSEQGKHFFGCTIPKVREQQNA